MLKEKIHKLLDDLAWDDVEAVAKEDASIKRHLQDSAVCRGRTRKVLDGRLASMGARKRCLILEGAERVVCLFTNKHNA